MQTIFKSLQYSYFNTILNTELLLKTFDQFIKEQADKTPYINLLIKVQGLNKDKHIIYYTLGNRTPLNLNSSHDLNQYKISLIKSLNNLDDYYDSISLSKLLFNFVILNEQEYQSHKGYKLSIENEVINLNKEELDLKLSYSKLPNVAQAEDQVINLSTFKRTLDNKTLIYKDNKVDLVYKQLNHLKYIQPLKPNKPFTNSKIMTLDIETYIKDQDNIKTHIPYLISLHSNINTISFFGAELFNNLFTYLLTKKFHNYIIYIHNSSSFDMIFLFKLLVNYKSIVSMKPIIKDGKFISLQIQYIDSPKNKVYKLEFRDSYLLLPNSLMKLSKQFISDQSLHKTIFPYAFVNEANLNYEGPVPDYNYFDNSKVSVSQYQVYKESFSNRSWNLLEQTKLYCEQDCIALFEVINSFGNEIYDLFKIDINKCPTLPSLAFKIFRTHYLKNHKIPIINKDLYKILNQAYYGGHVDMYIPNNPDNSTVYHYDVNSLYPTSMKYCLFPTDKIYYFINRNNDSLTYLDKDLDLGIYRVEITCPANIMHPILPIKHKGNCIYPTGTWTGWYFSEELKNASKYGYTYQILEGFVFNSKPIFNEYVDTLYHIKETNPSDSPKYQISKLLMNSLYGRFAMDPNLFNYKIISKLDPKEQYEDIVEFDDKYLVSIPSLNNYLNINITIGLAVTAYSRIIMSHYKNNPQLTGKLYYTDTDSIFCEKQLPDKYVGSGLGLMKLEHILTKFVSLGPKIYGGISIDNSSFTKVKGLKINLVAGWRQPFQELESLLIKDNPE